MKNTMTVGNNGRAKEVPSVWAEFLQSLLVGVNLERARKEEQEGRDPLELIQEEHMVPPRNLLVALSGLYQCPFVVLKHYHPQEEAVGLISHDVARRFHFLPLFRQEDQLYVAMVDPLDLPAQDYLRRLTGMTVHPVVALRSDLVEGLRRYYLGREQAKEAIDAITSARPDVTLPVAPTALALEDEEAPVIKLVHYLISNAIHLGASDIHLEPYPTDVVLRYRVDGTLHEFEPPPLQLFRSVVSRIKILANLDISERRLPQDGRLSFEVGEKEYDLRVSIIPGAHGEHVVVRVLDSGSSRQQLEDLGFSENLLRRWEHVIAQPYGMILVTGPTGSGKSTTLYTTLKRIYTPKRKILTLEDPIECNLRGISQFQINADIGFTFARGLRSALRHDPDVIMLGEIRDLESAEIALRSSLTGHLLFSTLHTNNAPMALTRLVDMGVPAFLVLSSLIGVLAQRLLRRLCTDCKIPVQPTAEQWKSIGIDEPPADAVVYAPRGCAACNHLGYRGRVGVHEFLEITPDIRAMGVDGYLPERLRKSSMWEHYTTLRLSAVERFVAGVTSLEEVMTMVTADD